MLALATSAATAEAVTIVAVNQNTSTQSQTQTGRLAPDGVSSDCDGGLLKLEPSLSPGSEGSSYRFVNHTLRSSLTHPVCIEVDIDSTCNEIFSVAYLPTFNPADPLAQYAADMGSTSGWPAYSFNVASGSFFSVVVHEISTSASCGAYTVTFKSRGPWARATPRIVGTPSLGSVLSGNNADWVDTPTVQRSWLRCDSAGANCTAIPGATGANYTVTDADLGQTVRFRNDATDVDATNTSQSPFVEPFIPFETHAAQSLTAGDRVQNGIFVRNAVESRCAVPTSPPTILQPASSFLYDVFPVGSLLNEPVCLIARTLPGCGNGVSAAIYNPVFAPASGLATNYAGNSGEGFNLNGAVSSTLPAGESREVTVSNGSSSSPCASYGVTLGADAPFASARPGLSGTPVVGGTLTASDGAWSGTPAISRSWLRCDADGAACVAIPGAAGASYTPTADDVARRLRVRVTATQGRSVSSDSEASGPVAAGSAAVPVDRTPPKGTLRLGSRNLSKALRSGRVPVRVTCDEACSAVIELRVTRKVARRLKLKNLRIARVQGAGLAGRSTTLRAKLTRASRRALRTRRLVRFTIAASVTDAAGNRSRPTKKAALKRPAKRPRRA